ncbi:MAG: hypothetical protein EAZ89_02285 [Bacteroidetes bacterium]|nr:MAG: hypothetical protein EAZ89_02285 [Bacteroidota bacterium]
MDVIGCEGGNLSPAEVFRPQEMEELINDLSRTYDYILIEGPELNQYADSRELERYVERVLPIFSSMDSISETDRESIAWLKSLGDKLCGSVLNQVDIRNLDL